MKKLYNIFILFIATGAFAGYIPFAPGTFGSMIGAGIYFGLWDRIPLYQSLIVLPVIFLIGIFAASSAEKILHEQDSGKIVIDEIAGMFVSMLFIPPSAMNVLIGFLCFRFFDILKPYPVSYVDRHVHGGLGVMLDDLLAGVFANILARVIIFLYLIV